MLLMWRKRRRNKGKKAGSKEGRVVGWTTARHSGSDSLPVAMDPLTVDTGSLFLGCG